MSTAYSQAIDALTCKEIPVGDDDARLPNGGVCVYEHEGRTLAYLVSSGPKLADAVAEALKAGGLKVVPTAYYREELEVTPSTALLGGTCELVAAVRT